MTDEIQFTMAELFERIDGGWTELQDLVNSLDEMTLSRVKADTGWAITDHLTHLAAWERGIAYLLSHRPRHEGMGITAEQWRELTMDDINNVVQQLGGVRPAADVLADGRAAHAELLDALAKLEVPDLLRDYADYDTGVAPSGRPVVGWVVGNTFEHYKEHLGYIREALAE